MNKPQNPHNTFLQFMLRAQHLARHDAKSDKGYAMLMTSMISIALLSMLAAYTTMANMSKSSTNAYVDGTNTFYAAESGLNRRAQQVRDKFVGYAAPTGTPVGSSPAAISNCFPIARDLAPSATDDFQCRNYGLTYNNNIASSRDGAGNTVIGEQNDNREGVNYIAYTFVADKTKYNGTTPDAIAIPSGETYAGLQMQEYKYTIYATANANQNVASGITPAEIAAKSRKQAYDAAVAAVPALAVAPTAPPAADAALVSSYDSKRSTADTANAGRAATNNRMNTVLQMDFKSRIVPLFQFAAFYDGDLEMSSSSDLTFRGRVHTNANLYVLPYTENSARSTTFFSKVTAAGSIYNRIDAYAAIAYAGITRVLLTGTDCSVATNCQKFPDYDSSNQDPLTTGQISGFNGKVKDGVAGATVLNAPQPGFLRKRNYFNNAVGEYYAKADMRLEMVPDRDVTTTGTAPWGRNKAIIPFNFTSIQTGGAGACTTTLPVQAAASATAPPVAINRDPANNYIDPDRRNASNLRCNVLTKGQLQSLRQPVLVLTDLNQTDTTLKTTGSTPSATSEAGILVRPTLPTTPVNLSATVTGNDTTKNIILRALQVALASTPEPVALDTLTQRFDNIAYAINTPGKVFQDEFRRLLETVPTATLPDDDREKLLAGTTTPNQIAALRNAWFLAAPIQRIESNAPVDTAVRNKRSSGFYDGREQRWMTMLQTNIVSLSVWNRDGLYVNASTLTGTAATDIDNTLTTAYVSNNAIKNAAFNNGTYAAADAASTKGFAFNPSTVAAINALTPATTAKGLQTLGLGSIDSTEGGLVLHATVNDDLNGNGTIADADDVKADTASPILKKNPDGTNVLNASGGTITVDYPRKYREGNIKESPFGFAFNGANYLPGALTLVTDQPIYVQGDFNNNGAATAFSAASTPSNDRLPASIIGDTITVLSKQCLSNDSAQSGTNHMSVPAGQLRCGLPRASTGSIDLTVGSATASFYPITASTAVNAAFLSYTDRSYGNLGVGRGFGVAASAKKDSGGVNNYMRMLENWGGSTGRFFNYSGSLVSLGTALEASGTYKDGGTYYNIPQRNFNFDGNFDTFTKLPPLSPRAVYLQQDVFKRNYN